MRLGRGLISELHSSSAHMRLTIQQRLHEYRDQLGLQFELTSAQASICTVYRERGLTSSEESAISHWAGEGTSKELEADVHGRTWASVRVL